jgi:formate dehydrogenase major subunit
MLKDLLQRWPLYRQMTEGGDGTGPEAWSERTQALKPRNAGAQVTRSICPYCGVGCGQLVFHRGNELVNIEGDPDSPISRGRLCPKGANSHELVTHPGRLTKVRYRAPHSKQWTEIPLEQAMDMVADRVWKTRRATFNREKGNNTKAICHLGGATLDNEENYLIKKLFTGGLGMVAVSNQARI